MNPLTLTSEQPYSDAGLNHVYNLLFCDNIDLYKSDTQSSAYPWDCLLADAPDYTQVKIVAADQTLEARQRLLAYHLLAANAPIQHKELLVVIIEVALPDGLDVLAAFSDGTARYINQSEKLLVWETKTTESSQLIGQLFMNSGQVLKHIGRCEGERRPFPTAGTARLTFLVSDGLYFGEGPFETLYADPMGGPVINSAIQLMTYLTQQVV
ncbi:MAG: hypothetical protein H7319_13130 [Spirosoma sp.]|nr:hypothetical protein [Spirosoma sp.]